MQLGKYFTLEEFTRSTTAENHGIQNIPNERQIASLKSLVENILDPLREYLGKPIKINSGFRSASLNKAIGGAATSQHCLGEAADIVIDGVSVKDVVAAVKKLRLPFDQMIDEFSEWTHISYRQPNRLEFLEARKVNGKTTYTKRP